MSGFCGTRGDGRVEYQPLPSKWSRYHDRHCRRDDCPGDWLDHAIEAGFEISRYQGRRSEYAVLVGPGFDEGTDDRLWEAVTGRPGGGWA